MGPPPWRPAKEIERAAERGDLDMAIRIARDWTRERGQPIDLPLALVLLPAVLKERPEDYSDWALRWLARWIAEQGTTIDQTADIGAWLAELPTEPRAVQLIKDRAGWR